MLFFTLFIFGLTGSLHCVGMCSPLMSMACFRPVFGDMFKIQSLYHLGRILTYSILGAVIGFIGSLSFALGFQIYASIVFAVLLMIYSLFKIFNLNLPFVQSSTFGFSKFYNVLLKKNNSYTTFALGMLNGILPCGLVYGAMAMAFLNHGILEGMFSMVFFGLGTLPILLLVTFGVKVKGLKSLLINTRLQYQILLLSSAYIIYKSVNIQMPAQTELWHSIVNPIMCH